MNLKKYQPIIEVLVMSLIVFLIHKAFFLMNSSSPKYKGFVYSLETIYEFFFICSTVIIFILIQVKEKNIDNVGYTFLLVTCIKMAISYAVLYPILQSGNTNVRIEKMNFFIVFAFFLTIETIITIRILHSKP